MHVTCSYSGWADRLRPLLLAVVVAVAVSASAARGQTPVDHMLGHLDEIAELSEDARNLMRSTWSNCDDCDGEEFLLQALSLIDPSFCELLDAYDNDDHARCVPLAEELRWSVDPFVAANAAAYKIKSLIALERFGEAGDAVNRLLDDGGTSLERHTYLAAEVRFLKGFTLLVNLKFVEARRSLAQFVERYPDGSPRLVLSARQMLAELANREPEGIGEVVDLMNYSKHRLASLHSGDPVQEKQRHAVELLDALIEEAEKQEKSGGSGGGSGSKNPSGQPNPKNSPSSPMEESMLPGGQGTGESLRNARRASPAEVWGNLPPDKREQILQALRENFPSRYRKLVEQYYEELAKKP